MSCGEYIDYASEYKCPKVGGSKKKRSKKRRSINDLKGHFLYGGQMGVNRACAPNDTPTKSELAWDSRHKVMKGGDGYSLLPGKSIGGMPGILRYTNTCRPYFPPDKNIIGGSKQKKMGLIEYLSTNSNKNKNLKNENIRNILEKINSSSQKGGNMMQGLKDSIVTLGNQLTPLGRNSLASLIVILFLNYLHKNKKISGKKKLGGGIKDYISMLIPMGKSNLIVLASLLLLNNFACHKKGSKQVGGNLIMSEITKILAPLGLNSAGASIILVALSKLYTKKQKGGAITQNLLKTLMPMGKDVFVSTGILLLLQKMFECKSKKKSSKKKQKGGNLTLMMSQLKELLAPLGVNVFLATSGLVGLKYMKNRK